MDPLVKIVDAIVSKARINEYLLYFLLFYVITEGAVRDNFDKILKIKELIFFLFN